MVRFSPALTPSAPPLFFFVADGRGRKQQNEGVVWLFGQEHIYPSRECSATTKKGQKREAKNHVVLSVTNGQCAYVEILACPKTSSSRVLHACIHLVTKTGHCRRGSGVVVQEQTRPKGRQRRPQSPAGRQHHQDGDSHSGVPAGRHLRPHDQKKELNNRKRKRQTSGHN